MALHRFLLFHVAASFSLIVACYGHCSALGMSSENNPLEPHQWLRNEFILFNFLRAACVFLFCDVKSTNKKHSKTDFPSSVGPLTHDALDHVPLQLRHFLCTRNVKLNF